MDTNNRTTGLFLYIVCHLFIFNVVYTAIVMQFFSSTPCNRPWPFDWLFEPNNNLDCSATWQPYKTTLSLFFSLFTLLRELGSLCWTVPHLLLKRNNVTTHYIICPLYKGMIVIMKRPLTLITPSFGSLSFFNQLSYISYLYKNWASCRRIVFSQIFSKNSIY